MPRVPSDPSPADPLEVAPHYYGGQAVIEGVMMRGRDRWSVAVRRVDGSIYVETHPTSDLPRRYPLLTRPLVRGVFALVDALTIGMRALGLSARHALPEEDRDQLGRGSMAGAMVFAVAAFLALFIMLPSAGLKFLVRDALGDGAVFHLVESLLRIAIFLAYLYAISLVADIRRVFAYHGAEHKTIAAWEHGEVLAPRSIAPYSTLHVRCGTNFLIIVMLLALIVYTLAGTAVPAPDGGLVAVIGYHIGLRVVLLPVIAGLAYEALRIGARYGDRWPVRVAMVPGLWLQRLTTRPPTDDQIEVAVRAFERVVPAGELEGRIRPEELPSPVVDGTTHVP